MKNLKNNLLHYISLNILGMLGMSCYILADTFFVAKALGTAGLASLNLSISIFSIIQGIGLMIGIGGATDFSTKEHTSFSHSLAGGTFASLLFIIAALFFTIPIATLLGADEMTLPLTNTYIKTILFFAPFFILNNILLAFIRNDGNPKLSMTAMLISSFSNIVLDYLFMFPLSMGIFGAAFATGLSPVISLCILSLHFIKGKQTFHIYKCPIRLNKLFRIAALGFSSFIGELASAISLIIFNLIIIKINGNVGVAAYGIVANIALIATAVFTGIAQGIQPLSSKYYSLSDSKSVKFIYRHTAALTVLISLVIYSAVFFFSKPIVSVFNSEQNKQLADLASLGLKIYFAGYLFAGINIVSSAFLSATFHVRQAMLLSSFRSCIFIVPLVFLFSMLFGMNGIWLSFVLTEFIVFLFTAGFLIYQNRHPIPVHPQSHPDI